MIYRHIEYGEDENLDNVKYLINYTFKEFPYRRLKKAHHLKLLVFIVGSKLSMKAVQFFFRLKNKKH